MKEQPECQFVKIKISQLATCFDERLETGRSRKWRDLVSESRRLFSQLACQAVSGSRTG